MVVTTTETFHAVCFGVFALGCLGYQKPPSGGTSNYNGLGRLFSLTLVNLDDTYGVFPSMVVAHHSDGLLIQIEPTSRERGVYLKIAVSPSRTFGLTMNTAKVRQVRLTEAMA